VHVPDGVNADLWRDNRRRWKISILLLAMGVLIAFVTPNLRLTGIAENILLGIWIVLSGAGMFGLRWASAESAFLSKPEPKEPPSLWRFR